MLEPLVCNIKYYLNSPSLLLSQKTMANPHRAAHDLGMLKGNTWRQWSDSSGLIYYENVATQDKTYALPAGLEDATGVSL